jgi:tetratricopeptide (TPR) repeat protein
MIYVLRFTFYLLFIVSFLKIGVVLAAETTEKPVEKPSGKPSIQLPEVIITGEDKIKVKRALEKPTLPALETKIPPGNGDASRDLVKQGDLASITNKEDALNYYQQAIQTDPQNFLAYLRLGDLYTRQGRYEVAAENYKKVVQINPKLIEVQYKLGILYDRYLKSAEQARTYYESYLKLGGKDQRVSYWLKRLQS